MSKHFIFVLICLLVVSASGSARVLAEELSIEGNSAGSSSTITVNSGSALDLYQQNSGTISTAIEARAETGGNSASGNTGGATVVTGDSTVDIQVKNFLNANLGQTDCCDLTPTPAPAPHDPSGPADPGAPAPSASNSTSSSNSSSAGVGGAPVILGLSATSSSDLPTAVTTSVGLLCLTLAGVYAKSLLAL